MTTPERTQQQLDPAAALGGRVPALTLCALAVIWAFVAVTYYQTERDNLPVKLLSLSLIIGAAVVIVVASRPAVAPFSMRAHLTVHLLTMGAFFVDIASSWAMPRIPQDAWVSGCLGLFLIAISPYRPARELVIFGSVSASIIGVVTVLSGLASTGGTRPLALAVFAVLPVLASCYGAARYSSGIVRDFLRWRRHLDRMIALEAATVTDEIARAVRTERVQGVAVDVMPLFTDILYQENITEEHRAQARAIAARLRGGLVADVDRTWLQTAIIPLTTARGSRVRLDDPLSLAAEMDRAQRTALHALLFSLVDDPTARDIVIALSREHDTCTVTIRADLRSRARSTHHRHDPFLAVIRTAFTDLSTDVSNRALNVQFEYDHR